MPSSRSILKRQRQAVRRRLRNRIILSAIKTLTKRLVVAIEGRKPDEARTVLTAVTKALDKAVTKGVLHRNNASRHISRLTRKVHSLSPAGGPNPSP